MKQLLHVKRLPCRGVQVINHGSSRSSRIARQNLWNIVILCTIQRLWRRRDGKERNYNAETGKLRHYFEGSRWNMALSLHLQYIFAHHVKRNRNDVRLTSQEQQTTSNGNKWKILKVVSSKAQSDVRPNYALFLTTTQFYSKNLAWLPWLVQGHLSLITVIKDAKMTSFSADF